MAVHHKITGRSLICDVVVRQKITGRSLVCVVAVRQKMTGRSRDDQVAVHLAVRDRNLILGANGHPVAVHSVRTQESGMDSFDFQPSKLKTL